MMFSGVCLALHQSTNLNSPYRASAVPGGEGRAMRQNECQLELNVVSSWFSLRITRRNGGSCRIRQTKEPFGASVVRPSPSRSNMEQVIQDKSTPSRRR